MVARTQRKIPQALSIKLCAASALAIGCGGGPSGEEGKKGPAAPVTGGTGTVVDATGGGGGAPVGSGGTFGTGGLTNTGGAGGPTGGANSTGGNLGTGGTPVPTDPVAAVGIAIDDIYFNQAVGARLVEDGAWVDPASRSVPLIHSRPALIQVTWALDATYVPHEVIATLIIESPGNAEQVLTSARTPSGAASLESTTSGAFAFELDSETLRPDARFSIQLHEANQTGPGGDPNATQFPSNGEFQAFTPLPDDMKLKVMIVPASSNCGGAPAMTAAHQAEIENHIYNLHPINDLEVRYHDPIHIDSCGEGDMMYVLEQLRDEEALGPDWHYQAHLSHDSGASSGGFAWVFMDNDADDDRVSWIENWWGEDPVNVVHELGHNHGSYHTFNDDEFYQPSAGSDYGGRETYGYAVVGDAHPAWNGTIGGRVLAPTIDSFGSQINNGQDNNFYDVMSYDDPYWIGAHNYNTFAERVRFLSSLPGAGSSGPQVDTVKIYFDHSGPLAFRKKTRTSPSGWERATYRSDSTELEVPVSFTFGCSHQTDTGSVEFVPPEGHDIENTEFSLTYAGRTWTHQGGSHWY